MPMLWMFSSTSLKLIQCLRTTSSTEKHRLSGDMRDCAAQATRDGVSSFVFCISVRPGRRRHGRNSNLVDSASSMACLKD